MNPQDSSSCHFICNNSRQRKQMWSLLSIIFLSTTVTLSNEQVILSLNVENKGIAIILHWGIKTSMYT